MIAELVIRLLALVVITWSVLPMVRHDAWWIRMFDFPRVQVTVITLAVILVYVLLLGWREPVDALLLLTMLACVAVQLWRIASYVPPYPKQVATAPDRNPDHTLSLLIANVLTPNRNADALLRIIHEQSPDIVLAVETDDWWQSKLDALEPDYPHTLKHPLDNLYGMHVYSRLELEDPRVLFLVEDDVPSMHMRVTLDSGRSVDIHCVHPEPPSPTEKDTSVERDAELLLLAKTLQTDTHSVVVTGDLNDVAWSGTTRLFRRVSGLLDPRIGRGMYSTFHARYPFLRWPLDHLFCSPDFSLVSLKRLGYFGSDHFPIYVELHHTPENAVGQEEPRADRDDEERAADKISKADVNKAAVSNL